MQDEAIAGGLGEDLKLVLAGQVPAGAPVQAGVWSHLVLRIGRKGLGHVWDFCFDGLDAYGISFGGCWEQVDTRAGAAGECDHLI